MSARITRLAAVLLTFVAVPLFAQQGDPANAQPVAPVQNQQPAATASSASTEVATTHVLGTIVNVTADRFDMKIEKAVEPSTESAAGLVGQTVTFLFDAKTEKPDNLKTDERADVWFKEDEGQRVAVRVVEAAAEGPQSGNATEQQTSGAAPAPQPPSADAQAGATQPAQAAPANGQAAPTTDSSAAAASSPAVTSAASPANPPLQATTLPAKHKVAAVKKPKVSAAQAAPQAAALPPVPDTGAGAFAVPPSVATSEPAAPPAPIASTDATEAASQLPAESPARNTVTLQRDDPLRFIAIGAAAALVALVMLFFTLRAGHVELGIGSGKGGVG